MTIINTESIEEYRSRYGQELHILIVVISSAWGGLEQTALGDASQLTQQGFKVIMLVRKGTPVAEHLKADSPQIPVFYAPEHVRNYFDMRFIKALREIITEHNINLIHCHQTTLLGSIVPALWRHPEVALVASRHILNSHNKRDPLHALIYRRVDYLLVLSRTMRDNLYATTPIAEKKLRVVPLAIDLDRFNPAVQDVEEFRRTWNIAPDRYLVGVVGRLDPSKGQDTLIKALAQASIWNPDIHGLIMGNESPGLDGAYLEELQKTVDQLGMHDRITILPAQQDVSKAMAALDLFVMPSWSEAFGLVALEAMAMGVPCILARGGSVMEIADEGRALTFRPRDAYDLALKIKYLYGRGDMPGEMVKAARDYVQSHHSRETRLERTLELYARCYRRRISQGA